MPDVESSAISRIEHDSRERGLLITFTTGRTYHYAGVPGSLYRAFLAAESKGAFFNDRIRDRFPTSRVGPP